MSIRRLFDVVGRFYPKTKEVNFKDPPTYWHTFLKRRSNQLNISG